MKRIALLALALIVAGCGGSGEAPAGEGERRAATPVEVHALELVDAVVEVSATGTVAAREDVAVSAEASGRVVEVPVKVGDRVSVGDALVRLDDELSELALRQADAQLLLAEAELDRAESAFERADELWKAGDLSDADHEAAETAYKSARAGHMSALAARSQAGRQLRNASIESPIDGLVAFVYVEDGQLVGAGTPVAHVVNDGVVEIDLGLNESQMAGLSPGGKATVTARANPGAVFRGSIEYVGPKANEVTKTYPVRVVVPNPHGRLRSGMVAEVTLAAKEFSDVIVVERDWVVERFGEPAVFVVSGSVAELRGVTLGRIIGSRVVVTDGLDPGDLVVSLGRDQLSDGDAVVVRDAGDEVETETPDQEVEGVE